MPQTPYLVQHHLKRAPTDCHPCCASDLPLELGAASHEFPGAACHHRPRISPRGRCAPCAHHDISNYCQSTGTMRLQDAVPPAPSKTSESIPQSTSTACLDALQLPAIIGHTCCLKDVVPPAQILTSASTANLVTHVVPPAQILTSMHRNQYGQRRCFTARVDQAKHRRGRYRDQGTHQGPRAVGLMRLRCRQTHYKSQASEGLANSVATTTARQL